MADAEGVKERSLKSQVLRGVAWASATRLFGQVLNWAMTLVVIRLLEPADYGLMAITIAVTGFLQSLSYVGFADALVQARTLDDRQIRQAFGVILLVNFIFLVLLCAMSWPVAWFYGQPRLATLLQVASLSFIFLALSSISRATLDKALALDRTARVEMITNLVTGLVVVGLAWLGYGVWALLIGMLLGMAMRAVGFYLMAPHRHWPIFELRGAESLLRFGGWRSAENLIWYVSSQADVFIAGKLLGQEAVGLYSVARTIAALPVEKVAAVVKPIGFSAFSRLQDDPARGRDYLGKAMRLISFIAFPIFFGIAAVGPEIVSLVLGPKWESVTLALQILAIGMALRPAGLAIPSFLMGIGEVRASFRNTLIGLFLFGGAYAVGSYWGVIGVCIGGSLAYPVQFLLLVRRVVLVTGGGIGGLLLPLARPLFCAAAMFVAVTLVRPLLAGLAIPVADLAILVGTGVAVYGVAALLLCRPLIAELRGLVGR